MKIQKLFIAVIGMRTLFAILAVMCAAYWARPVNNTQKKLAHINMHIAKKNDKKNCKTELLMACNNAK